MEVKAKHPGRHLPEVFYPQGKFHLDYDDDVIAIEKAESLNNALVAI